MSEALTPREYKKDYSSLEDFATQANLSTDEAIALLNNADFAAGIQKETKARARVAFHGRGIERLIAIADGEDDKTALSAINLLGKLAGEFKQPRPVVLNFNELMDKSRAVEAGPLSDITQIREAEVIDAADDDACDATTE